MCAIDQCKAVVLVLLDLSTAFDTVNHYILLHRLHTHLGISGVALSDRKQTVNILTKDIKYDVPQGSMLEPFLFPVNLLPLRKIITDHGVSYELYDDDNQLYIVFNSSEQDIINIALGTVISDTCHWLTVNFQKVNDFKTEMIGISSIHHPHM